jgi:hypothetical protein
LHLLSSICYLQISFIFQTLHVIHIINCNMLIYWKHQSLLFYIFAFIKIKAKNKIRTTTNTS